VNYLDLADGSDFVAGVHVFDMAARATDRYILSGVSSFPVLTAAVVRHLSSDMARVNVIRGGIAPSPYAGVGENVIRAIAGYAGQPVSLKRNGNTAIGHPFTEHMRFTVAPPGRLPLRNALFSLVDVPDLRALAELWPDAKSIWMGAGPVPEILHRALAALAWLVRLRLIPKLSMLAPLMHFATNHLRWGEHRGGMFVEIEGADGSGAPLKRSWHLLAEGNDGPLIPSMAVEALVRRTLDGCLPLPGARAAVQDLELDDYEKLFANRTIYTGGRDDTPTDAAPLYARVLGTAWDRLPPRFVICTISMAPLRYRDAPASNADTARWRVWPPSSWVFRKRLPIRPSVSDSRTPAAPKHGPGDLGTNLFRVANLPAADDQRACFANALAR
jgi:hypothetical protein